MKTTPRKKSVSGSRSEIETRCAIPPQVKLDGFASLAVPVYRASTIVFPDAKSYRNRASRFPDGYTYGLGGTPTTRVLEEQFAALHDASHGIVVPSGQACISALMLSLLASGDHLLVADNVYPPVKQFCREVLSRFGIETEWFDPTQSQDLQRRLRPGQTKLVWLESPGSTTMEVVGIIELSRLARLAGAFVGCDNTWATGLLCRPLTLGADVVVEALTKYAGGHSDLLLGALATNDAALHSRIRRSLAVHGVGVSPDECSLALRGIQTMALRLAHSGQIAFEMATRIQRDYGLDVLHPALPGAVGHEIWKRDFNGSSGVFSIRLPRIDGAQIDDAIDRMKTFAIGASWGGTRSVIAPMEIGKDRDLSLRGDGSTYLRLSIGLEGPKDLWDDILPLLEAVTRPIPITAEIEE